MKEVNKNNIDLSDLLIESPIKISILEEKFKNYLNKIVNPDCKAILNDIFARYYKDFKEFPAMTVPMDMTISITAHGAADLLNGGY